jgi:uncharacterized membrane-anchored protein YhcB (DUF1043 family)
MPQVMEAAPAGTPWTIVVVLAVGCLLILLAWERIRWLIQRQARLDRKHDELDERCEALERHHVRHEAAMTSIDARLNEIRQDGKNNTELLHVLIRGHVAASKD